MTKDAINTMPELLDAEQAHRDAVRAGVAEVLTHGRPARGLSAGLPAPAIVLRGSDGQTWSSQRIIGPKLVIFLRGAWCRSCRIELAAVERASEDIRSRGAAIVAISPDNPDDLAAASTSLGLSYPLLSDVAGSAVESFGLRWRIPLVVAKRHDALSATPIDGMHALFDVPGRFVIDAEGVVAYADVDPDFTRRLDPTELMPTLDVLMGSAR